jgi:hypothetical protein
MDDKGIGGFIFSVTELVQLNIPLFLISVIDLITWPLRLLYNTIIPDSLLF